MSDTDEDLAAVAREEAQSLDLPLPGMPVPIPGPEPLSVDRRRTLRQRAVIDLGRHPLHRGLLHEFAAPELCSPDAPKGQPFTCGSCRFRQVVSWHNRSHPKCLRDAMRTERDAGEYEARALDEAVNVSHGAATDVRAWWPACREYEPGDSTLSPDAARSIP